MTIVLEKAVEEELKRSYIDYAMSVIIGRALPNAFDGLKPVQRRILFAMHNLGLFHNKQYQKSAKIVGEVLGKYHPHGDSSIYSTLVRLAQDFSMRYKLVNGQGNFGSIDGDNAAAMRYTEVKMEKIAEWMLADIDKNTVNMQPNFDNTLEEPEVLPTRIPNLLINGSMGIAVGMATNIPPHNLREVVDGLIEVLENPTIENEELLKIIKGPDFPTGGIICGRTGIRNAYLTGRGTIAIRGKTMVDEKEGKIIVTEIPYIVNKSDLIEQISALSSDGIIEGIAGVHDYSDKRGIHIEIKLKKGAVAELVLNQLYSHTQLQTSFGIVNVAIVNNVPKLFTLKEMLAEFISFRERIVIKRSTFLLNKAKERLEIVEGLLIALKNIDEIVELLKAAESQEAAKQELAKRFNLSEAQSIAILNMRLQSLIKMEKNKLESEKLSLIKEMTELNEILSNKEILKSVIKQELLEVKNEFGDQRKTAIENIEVEIEEEELIEDENVVVMLTQKGYAKRIPLAEYRVQNRGGKGMIAAVAKDEDMVKDITICNSKDYLLIFTDKGNVFWLKAYKIPEMSRYASGKPIVNLLRLDEQEKVATIIAVGSLLDDTSLVMTTARGCVKRISSSHFVKPRSVGKRAITLRDGDSLKSVVVAAKGQHLLIATENGKCIRFAIDSLRELGRSAAGVRGIRLRKDDAVACATIINKPYILTVTENGYGKRTKQELYREQNRGGKGMTNIITEGRNGKVIATFSVQDGEQLFLLNNAGKGIRIEIAKMNTIGRLTKGVKMMELEEGEKVIGASVISTDDGL